MPKSSLARAVRIFAAFTPDETSLQVSEIARRAGLHVATTSRLIAELTSHGLLERGPDKQVRVGVRMWELASRASPTLSLRDAAMPYLEDVHASSATMRSSGSGMATTCCSSSGSRLGTQ